MNRNQIILLAVLVVQLILVAIVFWPGTNEVEAGEALLPDIKVEQISSISIEDHDGNLSILSRSGTEWVLSNGGDYPAKGEEITTAVGNLITANRNRLIASNVSSHDQLQVSDENFIRRIDLTLKDGKIFRLYIGSSPGAKTVHIRLNGEDEVYLAGNISSWDLNATPSSWVDTSYLAINTDNILAAALENSNGRFEFVNVEGNWTMLGLTEEQTLNQSNLTSILNRFASFRFKEPISQEIDDTHGLTPPTAILVFAVAEEDGTTSEYILYVGKAVDDGEAYIVYSPQTDYVVTVNRVHVESIVNHGMDDFVEQVELEEEVESAVATAQSGGPIQLVITEQQLTSLAMMGVQSSPDVNIKNLQVHLRDGQIQISGQAESQGIDLPLSIALEISVDAEGRPRSRVITAKVGPFSLPDSMLEQITAQLDQALMNQFIADGMVIDSIVIADGNMIVEGHMP